MLDVVFTPDGRRAVTASADRTARLWDLQTGKELQRFQPHRDAVRCVAVSEDGNQLLTGSVDAQVRLWDLRSGKQVSLLGAHRSWIRGVAFLPGSRQAVSCSNDRLIILWDLDTGQMRRVMQGHARAACSISAAGDGQHVVTGGEDTTLRLWNVHTEQQLTVMPSHLAPVRAVRFVPGSNYVVSAGDDGQVRLWNPFRGECLAALSGHVGAVADVALHLSAGLLVSVGDDHTARIWKLPPLEQEPKPEDYVSPSLDPPSGEAVAVVQPLRTWPAGQESVRAIAVTPDGQRTATGGDEDGPIRLWETKTGQLVRELTGPTDGILCVRFSSDGHWLAAAGKDRQIHVWDMLEDAPPRTLAGHTGWVTCLAFFGDGDQMLSGAFDATMRVWQVSDGTSLVTIPGQIEWIRDVAMAQDTAGPFLASAGNAGCVRLWRSSKGPEGQVLGFRMLEAPFQAGQISSLSHHARRPTAGGRGVEPSSTGMEHGHRPTGRSLWRSEPVHLRPSLVRRRPSAVGRLRRWDPARVGPPQWH